MDAVEPPYTARADEIRIEIEKVLEALARLMDREETLPEEPAYCCRQTLTP